MEVCTVIVVITYFPMYTSPINRFAHSVASAWCIFMANNANKVNKPSLIKCTNTWITVLILKPVFT